MSRPDNLKIPVSHDDFRISLQSFIQKIQKYHTELQEVRGEMKDQLSIAVSERAKSELTTSLNALEEEITRITIESNKHRTRVGRGHMH